MLLLWESGLAELKEDGSEQSSRVPKPWGNQRFLLPTEEFISRGAPTCHPVHQVQGLVKHWLSQEGKVFLNYQQMVEVSGSLLHTLSLVTASNHPNGVFVSLLYFPSLIPSQEISSVA